MAPLSIILNVHGGMVQDVFASEPGTEVTLVDWDVFGADHDHPDVVAITDRQGRTRPAYVARLPISSLRRLAGTDAAAAIEAARAACCL